jgi:putative membrane protein
MPWLTALHVIAFAAWMAGMWYLPRLLVYHAGTAVGSETSETFKIMERRLLRAITTPAMVVTLTAGILLASLGGWWQAGWLHAKLVLVTALLAAHGLLAREIRAFAADRRQRSARFFRIFNEVPTLLFIGIVVLAIVKPL